MSIAQAPRPRQTVDVVAEDLGEDVCLYRATDEVLVLNQTAADIWRLCDGESSVGEIADLIARAYSTSPEIVAPDIEAVISDLTRRGYLDVDLNA